MKVVTEDFLRLRARWSAISDVLDELEEMEEE